MLATRQMYAVFHQLTHNQLTLVSPLFTWNIHSLRKNVVSNFLW